MDQNKIYGIFKLSELQFCYQINKFGIELCFTSIKLIIEIMMTKKRQVIFLKRKLNKPDNRYYFGFLLIMTHHDLSDEFSFLYYQDADVKNSIDFASIK